MSPVRLPLIHTFTLTLLQDEISKLLPPNWEVRQSKSRKRPYFFNTETQESRWEAPEGVSAENKAKLEDPNLGKIRASHLLIKHKDSRRPSSWKEVSNRIHLRSLLTYSGHHHA